MPLGRSPLGIAVVWFFAALFAFVVLMNIRGGIVIDVARWVFGLLSLYCVSDLVYRVNHYHWR
jgi:hypothetical protein